MTGLENKTYKFYDSVFKMDDAKIKFYGRINFDDTHRLPILGVGGKSTVYKLRIGSKFYALKIFNGVREEILENYEAKLKIDIDSYISPLRIMYLNDKFSGYLMDYCKGKDLEKRKLNISVGDFARSSIKLFNDTQKLSLQKYEVDDTFITNIMYDDGFKMIDMDDYPQKNNCSVEGIKKTNDEKLNKLLSDVFVKNAGIAGYMFENVELQKLIEACKEGKIPFEQLFNQVCTTACENSDEDINVISDIGKVLRKTKSIKFPIISSK